MTDTGERKFEEKRGAGKITKRKKKESKIKNTAELAQLVYDVKICEDNFLRVAELTKQFRI